MLFSALRGCRELFFYFRYTIRTIRTVYMQRPYAENILLYCCYSSFGLCRGWRRCIRRLRRRFCGNRYGHRLLTRLSHGGFESDFPHNLSAIYIDSDPVISDDCVHIKAGNYRLLFTNNPPDFYFIFLMKPCVLILFFTFANFSFPLFISIKITPVFSVDIRSEYPL